MSEMIDLNKTDFLTDAQIAEQAPAVFTNTPSDNVSKHYTHISTSKVINDMRTLGWDVVDVKEVKARKATTRGVQKHLVVFRNPEVIINGEDGDTVFPQILLTNSHDGKNAFTFTAGLFRMICANGLVISTQQFEDVKMRHMGYTFEELQINIRAMVERLPLTVESMNKMKSIEMEEEQALEFAKKCLTSRFGDEQMKRIKVDLNDMINPTRREDFGTDVWSRFNVIQEKIIDGDFSYIAGNKVRKARRVKNFKQDQKINKELFSLALEYVN
jgi:NACalpha-BTF3-like transcription factor